MPDQFSNYISIDFTVLVVLIVGSMFYTFMVSRGKLLAILVSTYMAFVLVHFAPFLNAAESVVGFDSFILRVIVFGIVFLAVLLILSSVIFQSPIGSETLGLPLTFAFSFLQVGFLIAVFFSFLPTNILQTFSSFLQLVFASELALFFWAFLPVLFLVYVGYRINQHMDELEYDDE